VENSYKFLAEMTGGEANSQDPGDELGPGSVPLLGGSLKCNTRTDQGNPKYFSSLEDMNSAVARYCQDRVDEKLRWESPAEGQPPHPYAGIQVRDDNGVSPYMGSWFRDQGCPTMDFSWPGALDMCKARFGAIINNCRCADSFRDHDADKS
jgi:hypothetical protein